MSTEGRIYRQNGRYGYGAIDYTTGNSSGGGTLITGIKPNKLAKEFARSVWEVQQIELSGMVESVLVGDSSNSHELYLYATNTEKLYRERLRECIQQIKKILDAHQTFERARLAGRYWSQVTSLVGSVRVAFELGADMYEKEFPKSSSSDYYNFTPLDIHICVLRFIQHYEAEYRANGLAGYGDEVDDITHAL